VIMLHPGVIHRSTSCCVLLDDYSYLGSNSDPDETKAQHLKSATVRKEVVDRVFARWQATDRKTAHTSSITSF